MNDTDFLTRVISTICNYAVKSNMEPDETLRTVAENILTLLEISTFNGWGKDEEAHDAN